jgi:heme/copper-type cytochrome/quinol oxidase subunit 2
MRSSVSLLFFVMAGLMLAFAPLLVQPITPQERTFRIDARQFAYSPSELDVNPGDTITLQLVSNDVVHGLYVDGYDISLQADPGETATLTFIADKRGSFRFRCNVTCGAMHPFMIGKLSVGKNEWLIRSLGLAVIAVLGVIVLVKQKA